MVVGMKPPGYGPQVESSMFPFTEFHFGYLFLIHSHLNDPVAACGCPGLGNASAKQMVGFAFWWWLQRGFLGFRAEESTDCERCGSSQGVWGGMFDREQCRQGTFCELCCIVFFFVCVCLFQPHA